MGNRMSSLPLSQFCGRAPGLDLGAGRAAAISTAWHSRLAGTPGNAALLARLTPEEAEDCLSWPKPDDVVIFARDITGKPLAHSDVTTLAYDGAEKELEVCLNKYGESCKPEDPDCVSVGHLDMAWVVEAPDGMRIAYVGDLKKREGTSHPGSLQLIAYGFAYASLRGCDAFCCGIWAGEEGTWSWGAMVDLESEEASALWARVSAAAQNVGGEFAMGPHCRDCFSRFRCPAYVIPPEAAVGALAICDGQTDITPDKVAELVLAVARVEDMAKTAKEFCKDWEAKHPGSVVSQGKTWKAVQMPGRKSLDTKGLFAAIPEAKKYEKQGEGYVQMKWCKS